MARLFNTTTGLLLKEAGTCLCSLGVALLVLSVLLVPTSRLLADDVGVTDIVGGCSGDRCNNSGMDCIMARAGSCSFNDAPLRCNNTQPGFDCSRCACGEPPPPSTRTTCSCNFR